MFIKKGNVPLKSYKSQGFCIQYWYLCSVALIGEINIVKLYNFSLITLSLIEILFK